MNNSQLRQTLEFPLNLDILGEDRFGSFVDFVNDLNQHYGSAHMKWIEGKLFPGLIDCDYTGIIFSSKDKIVGDCVFRNSKDSNYDIELKHFRVADNFNKRGLATFMMNQLQFAHPDKRIVLDTTKKNKQAVDFFKGYGFKPVGEVDGLYISGQTELFMAMYSKYTQTESGLVVPANFKTQMRRRFLESSLRLVQ